MIKMKRKIKGLALFVIFIVIALLAVNSFAQNNECSRPECILPSFGPFTSDEEPRHTHASADVCEWAGIDSEFYEDVLDALEASVLSRDLGKETIQSSVTTVTTTTVIEGGGTCSPGECGEAGEKCNEYGIFVETVDVEVCDGMDNDCDSDVDEDCVIDCSQYNWDSSGCQSNSECYWTFPNCINKVECSPCGNCDSRVLCNSSTTGDCFWNDSKDLCEQMPCVTGNCSACDSEAKCNFVRYNEFNQQNCQWNGMECIDEIVQECNYDGICDDPEENPESCPSDCYCGDGVCQEGYEDPDFCPEDCAEESCIEDEDCSYFNSECSTGICDPSSPESMADGCVMEFASYEGLPCDDMDLCTGDGVCMAGECSPGEPIECPPGTECNPDNGVCENCICGDGFCQDYCGEDSGSCPDDCGAECVQDSVCDPAIPGICGDGTCEYFITPCYPNSIVEQLCLDAGGTLVPCGDEMSQCEVYLCNCPAGADCGDGICDPSIGEDSDNCPTDCYCGDGICDPFEDAGGSCSSDCGSGAVCGNGIVEPGEECEPNQEYYIDIMSGGFDPNYLEVYINDTVIWGNASTEQHSVVVDGLFTSGIIEPGMTFPYSFNQAGTYNYYCDLHAGETGTVYVFDSVCSLASCTYTPCVCGDAFCNEECENESNCPDDCATTGCTYDPECPSCGNDLGSCGGGTTDCLYPDGACCFLQGNLFAGDGRCVGCGSTCYDPVSGDLCSNCDPIMCPNDPNCVWDSMQDLCVDLAAYDCQQYTEDVDCRENSNGACIWTGSICDNRTSFLFCSEQSPGNCEQDIRCEWDYELNQCVANCFTCGNGCNEFPGCDSGPFAGEFCENDPNCDWDGANCVQAVTCEDQCSQEGERVCQSGNLYECVLGSQGCLELQFFEECPNGCTAGVCDPLCSSDADCDDGYSCTLDSCDQGTGVCSNVPDDSACSQYSSQCSIGICNPDMAMYADGCYEDFTGFEGTPCDDGLVCTVNDTCVGGFCEGVIDDSAENTPELCSNTVDDDCDADTDCDDTSCYGIDCELQEDCCPSQFCDIGGACTYKYSSGSACSEDYECESESCTLGLCD